MKYLVLRCELLGKKDFTGINVGEGGGVRNMVLSGINTSPLTQKRPNPKQKYPLSFQPSHSNFLEYRRSYWTSCSGFKMLQIYMQLRMRSLYRLVNPQWITTERPCWHYFVFCSYGNWSNFFCLIFHYSCVYIVSFRRYLLLNG